MLGRIALAVALGLCVVPAQAGALPLYAAREQKACAHCHVDPGGGGPRNGRGQYFAAHDHTFDGFDESAYQVAAQAAASSPMETLLRSLSFSGDMRLLYSMSEGPHLTADRSCESCHATGLRAPDQTFFMMQGEIGISARVSDDVTFVYSNDLGLTRDVFAVLRLGESGAFVKAGIFEVPYGIDEVRDHNTLVKVRHGVGTNLRDVGVELAIQRASRFASVALLNGGERLPDAMPLPGSLSGSPYDRNGSPSVVLRGGLATTRCRLGASFLFDDSLATTRPRQTVGGVFGTVFGETWRASAEVDLGDSKLSGMSTTNVGFVALLTWSPSGALDLSAKIDRYDPDTDSKNDGETWYTAMVDRRLTRNATLRAQYRMRDEEAEAADGKEIANDDFLTMLYVHF